MLPAASRPKKQGKKKSKKLKETKTLAYGTGAIDLVGGPTKPWPSPPSSPVAPPQLKEALEAELRKARAILLEAGVPAASVDSRIASIQRNCLSLPVPGTCGGKGSV